MCCGAAVGRLRRGRPPGRPITRVPSSRAGSRGERPLIVPIVIIVPPQAGILAVGAMTDRVVPMPGALIPIGVRPMLTLTLSCDHRVIDGARGAAFLDDVVEAVKSAERLLG